MIPVFTEGIGVHVGQESWEDDGSLAVLFTEPEIRRFLTKYGLFNVATEVGDFELLESSDEDGTEIDITRS